MHHSHASIHPPFFSLLTLMVFCMFLPLNGKDEEASKNTGTESTQQLGEEKKGDAEKKEEEKPPSIGNFALPTSQQPAALFGFGGNIIDKGEVQFYFFYDDFEGKQKALIETIPNIVYGITSNFSILLAYPFTPLIQDGYDRSSGLEDFFVQFEYAFYNKSTFTYVDQATILWNVSAPTGSIHKTPPTGFGAPTLFIGGTYYRTWVDWFVFTDQGALFTSSHRGIKVGDQFLYQFGLGRNVQSPKGYIYAWMVELDGQYSAKNHMCGATDPNSGGNVIYLTPSIWVSSKHFLIQFGFSFPVHQHLFGQQRKFNYALNVNCAWSFY